MKRTWIWVTACAAACIVLVGAVLVVGGLFTSVNKTLEQDEVPPHAATPEEITVEATARDDGTLAVTQKLVFDVPEGSDAPLWWSMGGTRIGWESRDDGTQFAVVPTVSDLSAVELTENGPGDKLAVTVDDSEVEDLMYDRVVYTFAPATSWAPGRHAVQISYVLDGVHIDVNGRELMVLPVSFVSGPGLPTTFNRIDVGDGNAIACLPKNRDFKPRAECAGIGELGSRGEPHQLSWIGETGSSVDAVAFDPPENVTAKPKPVEHREPQS